MILVIIECSAHSVNMMIQYSSCFKSKYERISIVANKSKFPGKLGLKYFIIVSPEPKTKYFPPAPSEQKDLQDTLRENYFVSCIQSSVVGQMRSISLEPEYVGLGAWSHAGSSTARYQNIITKETLGTNVQFPFLLITITLQK